MSENRTWAILTRDPIDDKPFQLFLNHPESGALVTFAGTVRDVSRGRRVVRLEYEAYEEMARLRIESLLAEAVATHGLHRAVLAHRLGCVAPGGVSVWIGTASAHRAESFAACRFLIEAVKASVPIWKKEYYHDGESWIEGESPFLPGSGDHGQ